MRRSYGHIAATVCYTTVKHSLGIFFRRSAELLNLPALSPVLPSRVSQYNSVHGGSSEFSKTVRGQPQL